MEVASAVAPKIVRLTFSVMPGVREATEEQPIEGQAVRARLTHVATIVTPDTMLRGIGTSSRGNGRTGTRRVGRAAMLREVRQLVVRMAEENSTWGYSRIREALTNLGHIAC